jgi:alcohol dehydrogenase
MKRFENAQRLIAQFKADRYAHGISVLPRVGPAAAALGGRAALVLDTSPGLGTHAGTIRDSLAAAGVNLLGVVPGAAPNAPREDVARIAAALAELAPDVVVSFGGGSTIDAAKAAIVSGTWAGTSTATSARAWSRKRSRPPATGSRRTSPFRPPPVPAPI